VDGLRSPKSSSLGRGDRFDVALTRFPESYADQNEPDYEAFAAPVKTGRHRR
jgi:hypothetical protein